MDLNLKTGLRAIRLKMAGARRIAFLLSPPLCYSGGMQWRESQESGLCVLGLIGQVDLHSSPELRALLQGKIKTQCPALILDFTELEYIESSGLATLVEYCRDARAFGGKLALAGLSERVRTVFDVVRLNEILAIYPTVAEAVAMSFARP